jgi:hypothetical protein
MNSASFLHSNISLRACRELARYEQKAIRLSVDISRDNNILADSFLRMATETKQIVSNLDMGRISSLPRSYDKRHMTRSGKIRKILISDRVSQVFKAR